MAMSLVGGGPYRSRSDRILNPVVQGGAIDNVSGTLAHAGRVASIHDQRARQHFRYFAPDASKYRFKE